MREAQGTRHDALDGQLRDDIAGLTFPFRLVSNGPQVRYEFRGPPPTAVRGAHYNEDGSELVESGPEGFRQAVPGELRQAYPRFGPDVRGPCVAVRLLAARGHRGQRHRFKTAFDAWKLRLTAPNHRTQYSSVLVWVDKDSGGLVRVDGFDWQGKLIKRFEVISVQEIGGKTYLKQMRIEGFDPASGHARSRTYLEIRGPAK